MKGVFDINCGDVISQQNNFVGVNFALIFAREIFFVNQAGLNEPRYESSRACEGVKDMNVGVVESFAEILAQDVAYGLNNKIDDFNGRVDNAELFNGAGQRHFEKVIVQVGNNSLAILGVAHIAALLLDIFVKFVELIAFLR